MTANAGIQGLFIAKTWGDVVAPASSDLSPPNGSNPHTHHFTHGTKEARSYSTSKSSATIPLGRPHWQIRKFDQAVTFNPFRPLSCPQGLGGLCTMRPTNHCGPTRICPRLGPTIESIALNNYLVISTWGVPETGILQVSTNRNWISYN